MQYLKLILVIHNNKQTIRGGGSWFSLVVSCSTSECIQQI